MAPPVITMIDGDYTEYLDGIFRILEVEQGVEQINILTNDQKEINLVSKLDFFVHCNLHDLCDRFDSLTMGKYPIEKLHGIIINSTTLPYDVTIRFLLHVFERLEEEEAVQEVCAGMKIFVNGFSHKVITNRSVLHLWIQHFEQITKHSKINGYIDGVLFHGNVTTQVELEKDGQTKQFRNEKNVWSMCLSFDEFNSSLLPVSEYKWQAVPVYDCIEGVDFSSTEVVDICYAEVFNNKYDKVSTYFKKHGINFTSNRGMSDVSSFFTIEHKFTEIRDILAELCEGDHLVANWDILLQTEGVYKSKGNGAVDSVRRAMGRDVEGAICITPRLVIYVGKHFGNANAIGKKTTKFNIECPSVYIQAKPLQEIFARKCQLDVETVSVEKKWDLKTVRNGCVEKYAFFRVSVVSNEDFEVPKSLKFRDLLGGTHPLKPWPYSECFDVAELFAEKKRHAHINDKFTIIKDNGFGVYTGKMESSDSVSNTVREFQNFQSLPLIATNTN